MKVVIAIDSFKGCLTSKEANEAAAESIRNAYPDAEITEVPVSDGGEGYLEAFHAAIGGRLEEVTVKDPLLRPIVAKYLLHNEMAVIEMRQRADEKMWPEAARTHFDREMEKLMRIPQASPDYSVQINYLNLMLEYTRQSQFAKPADISNPFWHLATDGFWHLVFAADDLIAESNVRNEQIISDVEQAVSLGRTPVILTKLKKHAEQLYRSLQNKADHVFLIYGGQTIKQNREIKETMVNVPDDETLILIATGQKIGEGFNFPRLDTLMLAAPIKFEGRLIQYIGRLNRQYVGKKDVIV